MQSVYDWDNETKRCSNCGEHKDLDQFHTKNAERGYYESQCKACRRIKRVARYKVEGRGKHLTDNYGITEFEYRQILRKQNGCCVICGYIPRQGENLHVDHEHDTGTIRGLLCQNCNLGIGHLRDNPVFLRRAASYLVRTSFQAA